MITLTQAEDDGEDDDHDDDDNGDDGDSDDADTDDSDVNHSDGEIPQDSIGSSRGIVITLTGCNKLLIKVLTFLWFFFGMSESR